MVVEKSGADLYAAEASGSAFEHEVSTRTTLDGDSCAVSVFYESYRVHDRVGVESRRDTFRTLWR